MTVYRTLHPGEALTPEQIAELDALESRPIVYDEDCPPLTEEALAGFQKAAQKRNRRKRGEAVS